MKIVKAEIEQSGWMPAVVTAELEDGSNTKLFQFYSDEISFTVNEFVGLTVDEAKALRQQRDIAYLQS